jgi:hypothetical protein
MALKPSRLQVIPQATAIIEQVHQMVNNMLRSFDLEKENLEEDNPFAFFVGY